MDWAGYADIALFSIDRWPIRWKKGWFLATDTVLTQSAILWGALNYALLRFRGGLLLGAMAP